MSEFAASERFQFGENWRRFLSVIDEVKISHAEERLYELVGDLRGKSFLDVGSGSGIHSLAAIKLGASRVLSFDYDEQCVACTNELKRRFAPLANWQIEHGSALDVSYLQSIGKFDVVYSWGVLHHTGQMWKSFDLITVPVEDTLAIAIYDDEGRKSRFLLGWKKLYVHSPRAIQKVLELLTFVATWGKAFLVKPIRTVRNWKAYSRNRGMSAWHDVVDMAGGYPFEVAKPGDVFSFFYQRGFKLTKLTTVTRHGLNEYVFCRSTASTPPTKT
ncbi:MAG TPA: 50S ribosomal protein L11 methyltransferase [Candidatus Angelobacter sp.]|nr:50S ribosomal protein L11 methyltransferase [Candidatus Angelobacter sp.]